MKFPPAAVAAGHAAESDAKWHLDRTFGHSGNYRVLHNVVIPDPRSSSPCQIDHLVVSRFLAFIVCETKSTKGGCTLKKENGVWGRWHNGQRQPMPSPIEQNKRHIECLAHFLKEKGLLPSRLGVPAKPTFQSWVLVDPGSDVPTRFDDAQIIPRDMIGTVAEKWAEQHKIGFRNFVNILKAEQLDTIASTIQPKTEDRPDESEEDDLWDMPIPSASEKPAGICENCQCPVDAKVVYYCRLKKAELGDKVLCQPCQTDFREKAPTCCQRCNKPVDQKVVTYCRYNWQKMGKRILCRDCQP